ncbi:MAG: sulfotransferase [Nostoc sp.]
MNNLCKITTLGENLIFIVGCPRSGTTYLKKLISSFPKIQSAGESYLFNYVGPFMDLWHCKVKSFEADPDSLVVGPSVYFTYEEFTEIARKLLSELMKPMIGGLKEGEFFLEKTPNHALHIHTIYELLPKARIIHILRDARDVVASLLAMSRTKGGSWAPNRADQCAQIWCDNVNHVRNIAPSLPKENFFELRYETLINKPTDELQAIANFLGMDWSQESIHTAIEANSIDAMRAKFGKGSIRRGGANYWQKDLTQWQKFQVWQVAGSTMASVGYDWRFPW